MTNKVMQSAPSVDNSWLDQFLAVIGSQTDSRIFVPSEDKLYHYTDLGGLSGIVGNHDVWLSNSRFLNDDEEIAHGRAISEQVIRAQRDYYYGPNWMPYLDALSAQLAEPLTQGIYICCFCRKDNLLSQWRGYGANGAGVSVEFSPFEFDRITGPDSPIGSVTRLWRVFYDRLQQSQIIEQAVTFGFTNHPGPAIEQASKARELIDFFIPTFKNPDFAEENECRLIFTPPADFPVLPRFRVARGMLIPYFTLQDIATQSPVHPDDKRLPITSVCVGPGVNKVLNEQSVRMLLKQNGYDAVEVRSSATPYRG